MTKASILSGSRLIEHLPAAGGTEAKAGIVGKFCVLFRELSVAVPLVDTGGIGCYPPRPALHQHIGVWHGLEPLQCGHGRGFGRPEGVVIRQSKQQKALHAPVGAAGGVVPLGHVHLRVAVADGQDTVPVEHFLPQPPVEVADDKALHYRQGQRLQPCPDAGRPEAVLGKAVGQAAAKGAGLRRWHRTNRRTAARTAGRAGGRVQHAGGSVSAANLE